MNWKPVFFDYPKNHWTLLERGLDVYSSCLGCPNQQLWDPMILRVECDMSLHMLRSSLTRFWFRVTVYFLLDSVSCKPSCHHVTRQMDRSIIWDNQFSLSIKNTLLLVLVFLMLLFWIDKTISDFTCTFFIFICFHLSWKSKDHKFNGLSQKTIILVKDLLHQQFQWTIILMVFWPTLVFSIPCE